jgi:GNAT superfamily N-acetyltransferase
VNHNINIRRFQSEDIKIIVEAFAKSNWTEKSTSLLEQYRIEQDEKKRIIFVAYLDGQFAGYITLKWDSQYQFFKNNRIPEIMDLNVLPSFRKAGIGTALLGYAEKEAASKSDIVGLGVGLYGGPDGGYGAAQKLYIRHGYVPDGNGVTYDYQSVIPGNTYPLDDDLVLWFTKKLCGVKAGQ